MCFTVYHSSLNNEDLKKKKKRVKNELSPLEFGNGRQISWNHYMFEVFFLNFILVANFPSLSIIYPFLFVFLNLRLLKLQEKASHVDSGLQKPFYTVFQEMHGSLTRMFVSFLPM